MEAPTMSNKPVHSCTYCGLVLSSANALMEHKRIHTGDRPFSCHICNKRFTQKAHLNIHKRTHTGEKPYACHICHKRFAQSSHLSSHKRIHTGEKPFVCGICHIGFTQKQRLDAHLKKHLERPGQEIVVRQRLVTNSRLTEPYKQHSVQLDDISFKKMSVRSTSSIPSNTDRSSIVKTGDGSEKLYQHSLVKTEPLGVSGESSGDDADSLSDSERSPKLSAPSFSSQGLFLHPSGYVAYSQAGDDLTDADPSLVVSPSVNHSHRRKPSVVRKRCSESPTKVSAVKTSSSPLSQRIARAENELKEEDLSENETDNFSSPCELLNDKNDSSYVTNKSYNNSPMSAHKTQKSIRTVNTRSSNRRTIKEDRNFEMTNGCSNGQHANSTEQTLSDMSLVKVNNRISLVNFTAEELVAHMMKRDDVNKCTFCCLIFQDAAMYHIHRNMHDKFDIRKCNMCGKLLQDKYDFTAHFLSTHQN
ncbi:zinc finger protein 271 [Biomphalaria glabrata]|nr:zinc finger protein 271 [Biomphalaria glabrata]